MSKYLYCCVLNDPVNLVDPIGLFRSHPTYGNFGGENHTGGRGGFNKPVDSMDECFKAHDKCYYQIEQPCGSSKTAEKSCDTELVKCLYSLPKDPRKWENPAECPLRAQLYRTMAIAIFQ